MITFNRVRMAVPGLLIAALTLTACGSEDQEAKQETDPTPTVSMSTPAATPVEGKSEMIMVTNGQLTPKGKLVQLKVGEPLNLEIMADQAGELHVHSTPEQTVEFPSGTTNHELVFDRPGVVEVEDHHTGDLVLKVQIR